MPRVAPTLLHCRGPQKVIDGITTAANITDPSTNSLAMTSAGANPYFIVDLDTPRADVSQIRIQARMDGNLAQSNDLKVLLGSSTDIGSATQLASGLTFAALGESVYVDVPAGTPAFTHIFVQRVVANDVIALQEVEALRSGERRWWGAL